MRFEKFPWKMPEEKIVRVITNTDAKNEADDQFAIVHALLSPKFDNVGFIAAHFGAVKSSTSMEDSYQELEKIFDIMKFDKTGMLYRGAAHALVDEFTPVDSPGAQLIIKEAMRDSDKPLFITFMGPLTDLASAYLLEPRIAKRLTAIWIGGGAYPSGGIEFNMGNDINAVNAVMKSDINLWQVPKNVYEMIPVSFAEMAYRVAPQGAIGKFLFDQLIEHTFEDNPRFSDFRSGESWVLGDSPAVGLILFEHRFEFDWVPAPIITPEGRYIHEGNNRAIRVYRRYDSRFIMEDFYCKLALFANIEM
ncbi:MAG: nucleoside hydrolase [Defluviitaleaceae bacterium]|nr:nucleoside hydrolase [Defluviitaleaceae bacterium]